MATEAQMRATAKYDKANSKRMSFKFNIHTDADILQRFQDVGNVQGYIKRLVREDIAREQAVCDADM